MIAPRREPPSSLAVVGLLAANFLPLAGVLWWGWSVFEVLVVYWLESGIVGALNVPRILLAAGDERGDGSNVVLRINGRVVRPGDTGSPWDNVGLAGFFLVHYGIFWVVHGVFVFVLPLFAPGTAAEWYGDASLATILLAAGSLLVSHAASFVTNYLWREEYRETTPGEQMFAPYGRVVVLHVTIIFGAFLIAMFGTPTVALVLLIALKTVVDLGAHLREHRRPDRPAPGTT